MRLASILPSTTGTCIHCDPKRLAERPSLLAEEKGIVWASGMWY